MKRTALHSRALPSVGFVSLGCPKNRVDSQIMAGALVAQGIPLAPAPEAADVIVVNTCAFVEDARREALDAILAACDRKKSGPCRAVLVAGCLPQRYRRQLARSLPDVDGFLGLDELNRIASVVRRLGRGERGVYAVSGRATRLFEPHRPGVILTGGAYAYLRVAEGCNHGCSFCAIPGIRGRLRSRPLRHVRREAESLLERGVRELDLIAQDVTAYGRDRRDGSSLPALLRELGRIGGRFWIRLLYAYPTSIGDELLETMASVPQVCRYLDVPVQHSAPPILRAMRRADTIPAVAGVAARARRIMPDIALRTTCLVGFPGETEESFEHLLDYARRTQFDHLGVFVFSPEEGTPAARLPHRPGARAAERRRDRLLRAQRRIVNRKAAARVGTETDVLVDRPAAQPRGIAVCRSQREAPEIDGVVLVRGLPLDTPAGAFVRVRVAAVRGYDMEAERVP